MIHPTAVIHPRARLGANVQVGPFAVIDGDVELGADSVVGPHVYLTGHTTIGARNQFFAGAVIGEAPQDLKYKGDPTRLRIGEGNVFRENVTVNRATTVDGETLIGSNCFLMTGCHIGHNSMIGNHVIIANTSALGGHVVVSDRAFISAACLVHQFVRIGTLAMLQGGAAISQDLPPFTIARGGTNLLGGLNVTGMRRAGLSSADRFEIRHIYHSLFRNNHNMREALTEMRAEVKSPSGRTLIEFVATSTRGVCTEWKPAEDEEVDAAD